MLDNMIIDEIDKLPETVIYNKTTILSPEMDATYQKRLVNGDRLLRWQNVLELMDGYTPNVRGNSQKPECKLRITSQEITKPPR